MATTLRAGRLLLLSACTLVAMGILVAGIVSYPRSFHVQLAGATGWELIADNGELEFNRYGSWLAGDGKFRFADLPAAPPAEVGWGNTRFYYRPDLGPRWGWQWAGAGMGSRGSFLWNIGRGSVLLRPASGGATIQVGHDIYSIPAWLPLLIVGLWPAVAGSRSLRRWWNARRLREDEAPRCPNCGYDLRATPGRCPECGSIPPLLEPSPVSSIGHE